MGVKVITVHFPNGFTNNIIPAITLTGSHKLSDLINFVITIRPDQAA